jgi:hypothetical protein
MLYGRKLTLKAAQYASVSKALKAGTFNTGFIFYHPTMRGVCSAGCAAHAPVPRATACPNMPEFA